MPIKKRRAKARAHRVTPAAVAAYRADDTLALHRALGLKPWEESPLKGDEGPSPHPGCTGGHASWPKAQALRAELETRSGRPRPQSPA